MNWAIRGAVEDMRKASDAAEALMWPRRAAAAAARCHLREFVIGGRVYWRPVFCDERAFENHVGGLFGTCYPDHVEWRSWEGGLARTPGWELRMRQEQGSGRVLLYVVDRDGRRVPLGTHADADVVGDMLNDLGQVRDALHLLPHLTY
ncbi:hypothetical protein [Bailinhaonella thermotolerans]|uniref:Uncharacterized protein n=1 Tax=Bailinhaonella thermotolerans TaxID=1070861 RepID=A0A3A4ABV5_9ACTN|nr:hypothetical protein [Bailinhaonella thermotolerans]RJL23984.1 hypothetical protein D5H75_31620 [Bailinhaonella thermotolerans]